MELSDYGLFANVVAIAGALAATFSLLILKSVGGAAQWTKLLDDAPPFLVNAAPRAVAYIMMAVTYVVISPTNWIWFAALAGLCGLLCFILVFQFDRARKRHVLRIPIVAANGQQAVDEKGEKMWDVVVIGSVATMKKIAKNDYEKVRRERGDMSVEDFMSGYGDPKVNNPGALWDREALADISSRLVLQLMGIFLCAVLVLYLAAFIVDVSMSIASAPNTEG